MTEEIYRRWTAPFRSHPAAAVALRGLNKALTLLCYVGYPLLLGLVFFRWPLGLFLRAILVPGISFAAVSVFRSKLSAPRPYEVLNIDPLIHKDTRGKSFPSRHVFSVFVIAATWLYFYPAAGIGFLIAGVLLAIVRVLGGVHFPRDVLAGAFLGLLSGWIGMWLIP
ncbi:MAG: phosphatase PAP2 family protein [Oscillospiraceae bacterium]|nr:phosphatase PAP2 family protein [Oscillospiraceae bacterium]